MRERHTHELALARFDSDGIRFAGGVGARPQLRAATDPGARGGQFYGPRFGSFGPPVELSILRRWDLDSGIRILWDVSERETGIPLQVG